MTTIRMTIEVEFAGNTTAGYAAHVSTAAERAAYDAVRREAPTAEFTITTCIDGGHVEHRHF